DVTFWYWLALGITYLVVLVAAVRGRGLGPGRNGCLAFAWTWLVVVGAAYTAAFFLPAVVSKGSFSEVEGYSAFGHAWERNRLWWHANLLLWLGLPLLALRYWSWAATAGGLAFALVMHEFFWGEEAKYQIGFWLWGASMALLAVGSLVGWLAARPWREGGLP